MKGLVLVVALLTGLLLAACAASESGGPLKVGSAAPSFSLPGADGRTVGLADYAGQKPVLLYFHMAYG